MGRKRKAYRRDTSKATEGRWKKTVSLMSLTSKNGVAPLSIAFANFSTSEISDHKFMFGKLLWLNILGLRNRSIALINCTLGMDWVWFSNNNPRSVQLWFLFRLQIERGTISSNITWLLLLFVFCIFPLLPVQNTASVCFRKPTFPFNWIVSTCSIMNDTSYKFNSPY